MSNIMLFAGFAMLTVGHVLYAVMYWRTIDAIKPGNHPSVKHPAWVGIFIYLVGLVFAWFTDMHTLGLLVGAVGYGVAVPGLFIWIHKWKYRDEYERVSAEETLEV